MSGGMLYPGADTGFRSEILPRHVTVINAKVDERELTLRESRIAKNPGRVLYKGTKLRGEYTQEHRVFYHREPAFIARHAAQMGENGRFPNGIASRGNGSQDIRVPVLQTVNGEYGNHHFDIEARISFLGVLDQPNRDNNESSTRVLAGGIITTFSAATHINLGEPVMACVPSVEEADSLSSPPGSIANSLGREGRIPLIWKPYRPQEVDFYKVDKIREAINRHYKQDEGTKLWTEKQNLTHAQKKQTYLYAEFEYTVRQMVEGLTNFMIAASHISQANTINIDDAAKNKIRSLVINAMLYSGSRTLGPKLNDTMSIAADTLLGNGNGLQADVRTILLNNPLQQIVRAMASLKLLVEDRVAGRAALHGPKGKNFDLHLHRYAH